MGKVDWNKRLSWGSPSPRTTSRFFSNADVKKFGRVFYDDFFFDGKRVALHDCIGVALDKNDRTGDETSRVLELWEDTKGDEKGHKCFRGRWLFYPRHLREYHPDATRKRTGLDARQVYEQCDPAANDEENYLASMRSVQRVLCCWEDSRNRLPSDEELQAAHAWFDSAWDDANGKVVPLSECVDKLGSARFALLRAVEIVQPPILAPSAGEAGGGARGAVAAEAPKHAEKAAAAVQKAPAPAAKPQAAAPPLAPPKAAPATAAAAIPAAPPKQKVDVAAKAVPVSAPPLAAKAVPKSAAAPAAHAAPGRSVAAPGAVFPAPAAAEKRATAATAAGSLDKLPSAAAKPSNAPALGGAKAAVAAAPPAKQLASVGDKRPRQDAARAVDEVAAKRVMQAKAEPPSQQQAKAKEPPPPPRQPFRIPKTKQAAPDDGRPAGPAPSAHGAGGLLRAFEGAGSSTLMAWEAVRGHQIVRVSGLPLDIQHSEWNGVVKAAKLPVLQTAVSGWVLPSNVWQGSGTAYLLCKDKPTALVALKQLNSLTLRCSATGLLRPLLAELCTASEIKVDRPFIGHLDLSDPGRAGARGGKDPIVPHFVQSNTLELDMSLQWRALVTAQFGGRQGLRISHVQDLARALQPAAGAAW